jgi:molecular chaperone DnaK (HSP70)
MKHEWFKLGLYPRLDESELSRKYPSTTALPRVYGSKCEKLVTAYLRSLRKHADKVLEDRVGRGVLATTPREYIVTVPAMWSEQAQDVTRACAEKAGMGAKDKIQIISEPEAAGIYALDTMTALDLRISDTFVVCDAGGG